MNRKQVLELEIEYILKDLKEGISSKVKLVARSQQRKLIPINKRDNWIEECYRPALEILKNNQNQIDKNR